MAKVKSKWYRPPTLDHRAPTYLETYRRKQQYRYWLAQKRGWTLAQVDDYLKEQERLLDNQ